MAEQCVRFRYNAMYVLSLGQTEFQQAEREYDKPFINNDSHLRLELPKSLSRYPKKYL
jgi:hypothetical protein